MTKTVASKLLGEKLEFSMSDKGGYIHLDVGHGEWKQICVGGGLKGATISAIPETFGRECDRWYRAYIRSMKKDGMISG